MNKIDNLKTPDCTYWMKSGQPGKVDKFNKKWWMLLVDWIYLDCSHLIHNHSRYLDLNEEEWLKKGKGWIKTTQKIIF